MTLESRKYRLVTRSDMDGLVCAVLLRSSDLIDDIAFVHPKDVQDGKVAVTDRRHHSPTCPTCPAAHMFFDHHASEALRNSGKPPPNHILEPGRDVRGAGDLRLLRRPGSLPARQRRT